MAYATLSGIAMSPLMFPAVVIGVALLQYVSLLRLRGSFLVLLLAALGAGLVFALITSFDEVSVTVFLLPPGQATLPVMLFTALDQGVDPSVAAVSILLIAATAILLIGMERLAGARRLF